MHMQSLFIASRNVNTLNHHTVKVVVVTFFIFLSQQVLSLPQGSSVNSGSATITRSGNTLNINQGSELVSINHDSFNIAEGETVNFNQPGISSIALNNITGNSASEIYGALNANGQVFLINPNGILFAEGSQINVGGLFASTMSMSDEDFVNGNYVFAGNTSIASIKNYGEIQGKYVAFVSPHIENHGVIRAGDINLHAADSVIVSFSQGIHIETETSTYDASIQNSGLLSSKGGEIRLTASTHNELLNAVINNDGVIEANGIIEKHGEIVLVAEDQGDVINSGTIITSAIEQNVNGGQVKLLAKRVAQLGAVHADGLGKGDGGQVHIKADNVVALGETSITTANAGTRGKGGEVLAFSPDTTLFRRGAYIEAKGGEVSGDGGYVDVSGLRHVEAFGNVNVSSLVGINGTFLVDPTDITIGSGADNMTAAPTFEALSAGAFLDFTTLMTALETGAAIVVRTDTGFDAGEAGNITIDPVVINYDQDSNGTSGSSLTLIADNDIIFSAGSSIRDSATQDAALDISLNAGNDIIFYDNTFVQTIGGNFTATAGGAFRVDPSSIGGNSLINSGTGTISITTGGNARIGGLLSTNATASAINLNIGNDITDAGETYTDIVAVNGQVNFMNGGSVALETQIQQINIANTRPLILNNTGAIEVVSSTSSSSLSLQSDNNITINTVSGLTDLILTASSGNIILPDTGITASGTINFTAQDVIDSDRNVAISSSDLLLNITAAAVDTTLTTSIDRLNAEFTGAVGSTNLTVVESNALEIIDLGVGTHALLNTDGDLSVQVASGNLVVNDNVQASDLTADASRSGMIDFRVDNGDMLIGNLRATSIDSLNTVDQGVAGGLDGNQTSMRFHNPANTDINSNITIGDGVATDVAINVEGGDLQIDNNAISSNTRNVTINSDVTMNVYDNIADPLTGTTNLVNAVNNGALLVRAGRLAVITGSIATVASPPVNIDLVENNIASNIQDEQSDLISTSVSTVNDEASPAELAFNQVFHACDESSANYSKKQCNAENELQNFLQSLLIGGQLPKAEQD